MDKPLHMRELRQKVAERMWSVCRSELDPVEPPPVIYAMTETAINEIYMNIDKMLMQTIKDRLERLI
jgi:hypothetical protein